MFTTFLASTPHVPQNGGSDEAGAWLKAPSASTRPRRRQVSRACGWCRTYRIKCDDKIPCRNCMDKGRQCAENGANELRTFSLAVKEINRLRSRVTELEGQLCSTRSSPQSITKTPSLPEYLDPLREHGGNRGAWEYMYSTNPRTQQTQCFGPASSFYFMRNMSSYMKTALTPAYSQSSLVDNFSLPSLFGSVDTQPRTNMKRSLRRTNSTIQEQLSRWQEEHFLDMFWQSYHCIYPVLDEAEFRAHHHSIWIMPYEPRKPSALVDIILALTMQYGTALLPSDLTTTNLTAEEKGKDAASAGRSYYRRCQAIVADELEKPSIRTLQCHVFSVIYLSNAGSHNTAHSTLALACRVAVTLGLHREPLDDLDEDRMNLQRHLWWTLYALEIKAAMELGRPLAISFSEVTCRLPAGFPQSGSISMPGSTPSPGIGSCFTANLQFLKLILAARSISVTFYKKCADALGPSQQNTLNGNPQAVESCAEFLSSKMEYLKTWLCNCPELLKMKRRDGRESFSTDGSPLDIQPTVSFLQQRQQLFLELHYHTVAMNLFRHFINFSQNLYPGIPQIETNAISCVDHAMTITNIIYQILTETDLLGGWLESFHWHGNAFLSLVGYILSYPAGHRTPEARRAIRKAILTFDILSNSLAMAASAANIARELVAKVDLLVDRFHTGSIASSPRLNDGRLLLDPGGNPVGSGASMIVQNPGQPDSLMTDAIEMGDSELWWPELLHSFDLTGGRGWSMDGSQTSDIWTLGEDLDADSFNRWLAQNTQT